MLLTKTVGVGEKRNYFDKFIKSKQLECWNMCLSCVVWSFEQIENYCFDIENKKAAWKKVTFRFKN